MLKAQCYTGNFLCNLFRNVYCVPGSPKSATEERIIRILIGWSSNVLRNEITSQGMENPILGIFGTRPSNGLTPDAVEKRRGEEKK